MTFQLPSSSLSSSTMTTQSSSQLPSQSSSSSQLSSSTAFVNYVMSYKRQLNAIDQHHIVFIQTILNLLHSRTSDNFIIGTDHTYTLVACLIFSLGGKVYKIRIKILINKITIIKSLLKIVKYH